MTRAAAHGAIAVLAGLLLSTVSAQAADLGGNCCADLEERVAELEATTARKGNRRMSLTVSGQVSRSILYWNDGEDSGTHAGLDNHAQSTRFVFSGTAKVRPDLTAGFELMTEIGLGARTSASSNAPGINGADGATNVDGNWGADSLFAIRTANWWLEDKRWGRVTVGRLNLGGPVSTIDLGGITTLASGTPFLVGGGYQFRTGAGALGGSTFSISALTGPSYGGDRIEGIRYDSPTIGGFVAQATWGEDEVWTASLRYAGEFSGFRVAAGIGYQDVDPRGQLDGGLAVGNCTPVAVGADVRCLTSSNTVTRATSEWSGSLALMHVASGLFAQGHYARSEFDQVAGSPEATFWLVQAGITKNWWGPGNTSFFGEYGEATDFGAITQLVAAGAPTPTATGRETEVTFFGLGVVQQIDAAAMEVFLGWRRFELDCTGAGCAATGYQDLDIVHGGARVRF